MSEYRFPYENPATGEIDRVPASLLKERPTLVVSQTDDLKAEYGDFRVWLARTTIEDGEPCNNRITIERLIDGKWVTVDEYEG